MRRIRTAGVVALVLAVALAGCSGLTGGDGTPSATDAGPNGGPDGGAVDTDAILSAHTDALDSAGSYTTNATIAINGSGPVAGTQSVDYLVDTENDQAMLRQTFQGATVVQYTAGDTTYLRQSQGGNATYRVASEPYGDGFQALTPVNTSQAANLAGLGSVLGNVTYEQTGSGTVDGVAVTQYEASGSDAINLGNNPGNVTGFESTLAVADDSGVVQSLTLSISIEQQGQTQEQDIEVTTSAVGSTTVPEPDWLDEAREQNQTAS